MDPDTICQKLLLKVVLKEPHPSQKMKPQIYHLPVSSGLHAFLSSLSSDYLFLGPGEGSR